MWQIVFNVYKYFYELKFDWHRFLKKIKAPNGAFIFAYFIFAYFIFQFHRLFHNKGRRVFHLSL